MSFQRTVATEINQARKNIGNYSEFKLDKKSIEHLLVKLNKVSKDVSRLAPSRAVRAGGKVIINEMKKTVAVDTGKLRKSITQKIKKYRKDGNTTSIIGAKYTYISGRERFKDAGIYVFFNEFNREKLGTKHKPFMRKAFLTAGSKAVHAVKESVKNDFDKVAKTHKPR